ncbi:MAG: nucleotidyltransferase domain-containing protein [Candidatus Nanoarchaeia archaeon]|nr:nucleotidyltransferase domain-containing protein [Candidatus Nanoarchaeia archaeon]
MLSNYNKWAVLTAFFNEPLKEFGLRELSRKVKLAPKSVKNYLKEFIKQEIIIEKSKDKTPLYNANRDNKEFIFYKKINNQSILRSAGLIDYIYDACLPDVMILFGSFSKGEDIKTSDVDIYLQCNDKRINLEKYEKLIERKINLFFSSSFNKLSNELKNNILNGVIMKGYLKVF